MIKYSNHIKIEAMRLMTAKRRETTGGTGPGECDQTQKLFDGSYYSFPKT